MYADDDFVTAYWHQVTGSLNYNSWTYPCKSKKLPDLTVSIGGSGSATIPGDMFRGEEVDSGKSFFFLFFFCDLFWLGGGEGMG